MIDRTNLTKKQTAFLDMVDKKIARGLDDIENGRTGSLEEARIFLKNKIKNNKNNNTKQQQWVIM